MVTAWGFGEGWRCRCCADGLEWCSSYNAFLCCGAAPEGQRGQGLYRKCGQETDHHGPADKVSLPGVYLCRFFYDCGIRRFQKTSTESSTDTT